MGANGKVRVGISGSYGGLNLGDEAILHVIISELRRTIPVELTVFSRDANDTRRRHDVEHVVQTRGLSRHEEQEVLAGLDLFILGGGGILYDADAEMYVGQLERAHDVGTRSMVYAVSAGPLGDPAIRQRVRAALDHVDAITVRDKKSARLLEEIGVGREVVVTADPALLLRPDPLSLEEIVRGEAFDPDARLIGFSVREPGPAAPDLDAERYHQLVANAADFVVDRLDAEIVFVPMERRMFDVQHSHGVVAQMRHAPRATVLKREYTPGQILSLLSHFEFTVGMRLHFLIFSALANLPFAGLPYAEKVKGFLEELGLPAPGLDHVSAGQLIAHIDRAWDVRDTIRARVRDVLPSLQARARENNRIAAALAKSRPSRTADATAGI